MSTENQEAPRVESPEVFQLVSEFEHYNFSDDAEFQAGLPSIVKAFGNPSNAANIDDVIGRAQWFYYTRRRGLDVPFESYVRNRTNDTESLPMRRPPAATASKPSPPTAPAQAVPASSSGAPTTESGASAPADGASSTAPAIVVPTSGPEPENNMSFEQIVKLISEGRADEVPTVHIPDGLNDAPPSKPTLSARPKPWEAAGGGGATQAATTNDAGADSQQPKQPIAPTPVRAAVPSVISKNLLIPDAGVANEGPATPLPSYSSAALDRLADEDSVEGANHVDTKNGEGKEAEDVGRKDEGQRSEDTEKKDVVKPQENVQGQN